MATNYNRPQTHTSRRSGRSPGSVWSDNRYKAWYWVAGFIVVVAVLLLLAY
jgi:hypothetical protein